jgi:hypothetical protein
MIVCLNCVPSVALKGAAFNPSWHLTAVGAVSSAIAVHGAGLLVAPVLAVAMRDVLGIPVDDLIFMQGRPAEIPIAETAGFRSR